MSSDRLRHRSQTKIGIRGTPIWISEPVWIFAGIRIPVETRARSSIRQHGIGADELPALRIIVPLLHVAEASGRVLLVAGVTRTVVHGPIEGLSVGRVLGGL